MKHHYYFCKNFSGSSHLIPHSSHKCAAFTLAEVLITLGIIGVVAALTMPSFMAHYKAKVLEAQFKKASSTLTNATLKLIDQGLSPYDLTSEELIEQYAKVLNASKYSDNLFCERRYYVILKTLTGNSGAVTVFTAPGMMLNDGSLVIVGRKRGDLLWINVDINGPIKGPNQVGHDLHVFAINANNNLIPLSGGHDTRQCTMNSTDHWGNDIYVGYGCTGYALMNKNPDGDGDYWYNFLKTAK